MQRTKPPFRADHVGSLLRPAALKEAREKRAKGEISAAELEAVEDREIERVIKKQEEIGLQVDHRRRVPPLVVAPRFPLGTRWRRDATSWTPGIAFAAVTTRNEGVPRHRQARLLRPSDDRALQVRGSAHQAARRRSRSRRRRRSTAGRCRRRSTRRSIRRSTTSSTTSARPIARRCAPSPTPAAATCSSTRSSSPCCATRSTASR